MRYLPLACAPALALAATLAFAQTGPQDHAAHHPEDAPSAPGQGAAPAQDRYIQQIRSMQDMHGRMQAARTAAERQALMAEHMRIMQSGMEMLSQMGAAGGGMGMMGDMGLGMGGMPGAPAGAAPGPQGGMMNGMMGMHGAMQRRMALLEQMMQMMVDREAARPRR